MRNVFATRGASAHNLNSLAEWIRESVTKTKSGEIDVIKFIEIDLPELFPGLYVHVEDDDIMGKSRAFISDNPLSIVVSESIYEGASNGCLFSSEVILHEVGHLFLHHRYRKLDLHNACDVYIDRIKDTNLANSAEWQASIFAICLLYPYKSLKECNSIQDITSKLIINRKQADRLIKHLKRLQYRENDRNFIQERRWLKEVIESLPIKESESLNPPGSPIQLSLFPRTYIAKPEHTIAG